MNTCPSFSSHANLTVQVVQTGPTATQTDTSMDARANKGAGNLEGVLNVPDKGKEVAAEASLDSVMHLDVSKRDSMKRLFRMDIIRLSLQQRSRELAIQRRRRSQRRKAPRRPRRVKRARGLRGNAR